MTTQTSVPMIQVSPYKGSHSASLSAHAINTQGEETLGWLKVKRDVLKCREYVNKSGAKIEPCPETTVDISLSDLKDHYAHRPRFDKADGDYDVASAVEQVEALRKHAEEVVNLWNAQHPDQFVAVALS